MSNDNDGRAPVEATFRLDDIVFDERGLVPVVAQQESNGEVLMLAWANLDAVRLTLETGRAHYFSRSRAELWRKGDTSGNVQEVFSVSLDCDGDAVLYLVRQSGPACHTGARSCFFRRASNELGPAVDPVDGELLGSALSLLERVVTQRLRELPADSYVTRLHARGIGYMAQKVVEEAGETVVAALQERDDELVAEAADLLFHLSVLLRERGLGLSEVLRLLETRHHDRRSA